MVYVKETLRISVTIQICFLDSSLSAWGAVRKYSIGAMGLFVLQKVSLEAEEHLITLEKAGYAEIEEGQQFREENKRSNKVLLSNF